MVIKKAWKFMKARSANPTEQFRDLNIQRNTDTLISKLPDDVLLGIFALIRIIFPEEKWYREVTHVCRHWRHIAIEAATLWTNPPLYQHDFAMLMLERSKSANLTIHMESNLLDKTIQKVLDCFNRVENLEVRMKIDMLDALRDLMAAGDQQASRLRRFILHGLSAERWDSRPMIALPTFCQLRSLRELDVANMTLDWNIFPLPNLVLLKLRNTSWTVPPSIRQLLHTLRQMPLLEDLQIPVSQFSSTAASATDALLVAQVILPRLNALKLLDSTTVDIPRILSNITLPRLRQMVIEPPPATFLHPDNGDPSQTIHEVVSSVTGGDFGTFDSLSIFSTCFQLNMFNQLDTARVHIQLRGDNNSSARFHQIFVDILLPCRAQLSNLVEVQLLGHQLSMSTDAFFSLSTVLNSVRRLKIYHGEQTILTLIQVLELSAPYPLKAGLNGFVPFPSLDSIEFYEIFFSPSTLDALCNALRLRLKFDVPTLKLAFNYCHSFSSHLTLLEETIGRGNLSILPSIIGGN